MKRTLLLCLANLAMAIGVMFITSVGVSAQNRIQVFGPDRLANASAWWESDAAFYPSTPAHNATVVFPANKWSAFIGDLPLKGLDGSFTTHIRYRWITDLTTIKGASATVQFGDIDGHDITGSSTPLVVSADWQELTVTAKIPKEATKVRYDIDCGAGAGTLEISDYDLYLDGANLTDAAVSGAVLPWLDVPGGSSALPPADPSGAGAIFTPASPYSFDSPVWTTLKQYSIPTTTDNKTPLNDVSANFQVAWTPDALFVRYHAHDPILNFKAKSRYARDCFEFFLMPTGSSGKSSTQISKEQYTISRTTDGQTDANTDAISRLVSDGWEAIVKIPLQTETRRLYPFNGLTMTFNAVYQDADTLPQEHWLSFSQKDQTNDSWHDTSLYVPLVFETDNKVAFKPFYLGGSDQAYNVAPNFPGRINLVHNSATLANLDMWDAIPEAKLDAYTDGSHNVFRIKYIDNPRQRRVVFDMSPFNVLAGETLDVSMDARVDNGSGTSAPGLSFLSESCWNITGGTRVTAGDLTSQWSKLAYTISIPDTARGNLRNGRLLFDFGVRPGTTVELRDIKVTRRIPVDFDALISAPSHYSHYWAGEKNIVDFQFSSGIATDARVSALVVNYFTGKTVLSHAWTKERPAGESTLTWDISTLPSGFFNVLLKVRDSKGGFLADRELYVSKSIKDTRSNPFSGIFAINDYDVAAPASIPDTIAELKGIGEGRAQWADFFLYDTEGEDLPGDHLALLKAFHNAGFETGFTVPQGGTHDIGRIWQPDELSPFYDRFLTTTKGLFTHLSFSNESNLYGGWFPEPDAREWAIYNRVFYDAVERLTPTTRPILGSFNDIAVDYVKTTSTENSNSFADGVMGFHLYGIEVNGGAFKEILDDRYQLDRIHPGWQAWDTESGLVFYTFDAALDLQSKKMPILLCGGYKSSIYLDGYGYTFPCGDSTPLVPMEAFKNYFYLDSTPIGRVTSPDGKVDVYLFRHSDGQGLAAFWNTSQDKETVDLPIRGGGRYLDVFGNSLGLLANGKNSLALGDRFVRYARGVDLGVLTKDPTFIPAFKSGRAKPKTDPGFTTSVYLTPVTATKAFDREIVVGKVSDIALSLHNDGTTPARVKLGSEGPIGLQVTFPDNGAIILKPQETRVVSAAIKSDQSMDWQSFSLTGTLENGIKVMPLQFSVRTTPAVVVSGYSRAVEITNNAIASADVNVVATKPEFVFQPGVVKATLASGASQAAPLQILPNGAYHGNFNTLNVPVYYSMSVSSSQATYVKDGLCTIFSPDTKDNGAAADFANLPYTAAPAHAGSEPFLVDYKLSWAPAGLRVIARAHDSSPNQTGQNGYIRAGGDCMVLAFDPNDGPNDTAFGANYVEFGFAFSHGLPTSYRWDGHYGLESSTPFPEAINKVSRDANYIYYDVTIPEKLIFQQGGKTTGMSIAFLNNETDGSAQMIELGQGIFPQRDAAKMGLLLRRQ